MSEEISNEAMECAKTILFQYSTPVHENASQLIQLLLNQRDTKIAALEAALDGILTRYLNLVLSGDCGSWNPEKEAEVIAARAALNSTKGEK